MTIEQFENAKSTTKCDVGSAGTLLSKDDWSNFNNTMIKKEKAANSNNSALEFSDPYKSETKKPMPEEDMTRLNKKLKELKNSQTNSSENDMSGPTKKPNASVKGATIDGFKPKVPLDGGPADKFNGKPKAGATEDINGGKSKVPADGGIKGSVKPNVAADGGVKEISKPNVAADGGVKDFSTGGKANMSADGGTFDASKPAVPADGGAKGKHFESTADGSTFDASKPEVPAEGGVKQNFKADSSNGGEKSAVNPPAPSSDATNDPAENDELSLVIPDIRETYGNYTLATAAPPLRDTWTVNGDGSVTRGQVKSQPVNS
ncbi:MAG: hypothetical protein SGJ27_30910 [Candidatus Melainabacteria bacterium]|nr:hypothetical protein [Candidatus Melainabacteria bacterium]